MISFLSKILAVSIPLKDILNVLEILTVKQVITGEHKVPQFNIIRHNVLKLLNFSLVLIILTILECSVLYGIIYDFVRPLIYLALYESNINLTVYKNYVRAYYLRYIYRSKKTD